MVCSIFRGSETESRELLCWLSQKQSLLLEKSYTAAVTDTVRAKQAYGHLVGFLFLLQLLSFLPSLLY